MVNEYTKMEGICNKKSSPQSSTLKLLNFDNFLTTSPGHECILPVDKDAKW
jgi:hypothetical protein